MILAPEQKALVRMRQLKIELSRQIDMIMAELATAAQQEQPAPTRKRTITDPFTGQRVQIKPRSPRKIKASQTSKAVTP